MDRALRKIAFVSPHCAIDFTNGAATATLDALVLLQSLGFQCQAFCSSRSDSREEVVVEKVLAERGLPYQVRNARIGACRGRMIFTAYQAQPDGSSSISDDAEGRTAKPIPQSPCRTLPVTIFSSASSRGGWRDREEVAAFLSGCEIFLRRNRPDLVWTYGGDPVSLAVQKLAKHLGIPVLFFLHNFSYRGLEPFRAVDRIAVPSRFSRDYYRNQLGLECEALPYVIDPGRVSVAQRQGTHLPPREVIPGAGLDECTQAHLAERDEYVRAKTIRLWDDAAYYDCWSSAGRERAQAWHPERLAPLYGEFFGRIAAGSVEN